jgi:hypothetical protein
MPKQAEVLCLERKCLRRNWKKGVLGIETWLQHKVDVKEEGGLSDQ